MQEREGGREGSNNLVLSAPVLHVTAHALLLRL